MEEHHPALPGQEPWSLPPRQLKGPERFTTESPKPAVDVDIVEAPYIAPANVPVTCFTVKFPKESFMDAATGAPRKLAIPREAAFVRIENWREIRDVCPDAALVTSSCDEIPLEVFGGLKALASVDGFPVMPDVVKMTRSDREKALFIAENFLRGFLPYNAMYCTCLMLKGITCDVTMTFLNGREDAGVTLPPREVIPLFAIPGHEFCVASGWVHNLETSCAATVACRAGLRLPESFQQSPTVFDVTSNPGKASYDAARAAVCEPQPDNNVGNDGEAHILKASM
jgi:hypothetical protein